MRELSPRAARVGGGAGGVEPPRDVPQRRDAVRQRRGQARVVHAAAEARVPPADDPAGAAAGAGARAAARGVDDSRDREGTGRGRVRGAQPCEGAARARRRVDAPAVGWKGETAWHGFASRAHGLRTRATTVTTPSLPARHVFYSPTMLKPLSTKMFSPVTPL